MSTNSRSSKLSVKDLISRKRKGSQEAASETDTIPPPIVKKEKLSSPATRTRAQKGSQLVITIPDEGSDDHNLHKLLLPKIEEEEENTPLHELVNAAPKNIFKTFQESLVIAKKLTSVEKEKHDAIKNKEKLEKEVATLKKRIDLMKVEVVDAKTDLSKSEAEKAEQICEVARLKAEMDDNATYYAWKARLEAMEEHMKGKSSEWNFEVEKKEFEEHFKDFVSENKEDKGGAAQETEVQSKGEDAPVEALADNTQAEEKTTTPVTP